LVLMVPTLKRKHGCLSKLVEITTNTRNVKGYRVYYGSQQCRVLPNSQNLVSKTHLVHNLAILLSMCNTTLDDFWFGLGCHNEKML